MGRMKLFDTASVDVLLDNTGVVASILEGLAENCEGEFGGIWQSRRRGNLAVTLDHA